MPLGDAEWLAQTLEPTREPDLPICDPHHHLWVHRPEPLAYQQYLLADLAADIHSGHNVRSTVFIEVRAEYLTEGPEALRPVGEVAFVQKLLDEGWLKVFGKGQKERIVPFGLRATGSLREYLTGVGEHRDYVFLNADGSPLTQNAVKMLFGRLRARTGLPKLHPHLLRHTFATRFLMAGGDVFSLQAMLGHTTLEMTRRYVTLANSYVAIQHRRFSPMDRWVADYGLAERAGDTPDAPDAVHEGRGMDVRAA